MLPSLHSLAWTSRGLGLTQLAQHLHGSVAALCMPRSCALTPPHIQAGSHLLKHVIAEARTNHVMPGAAADPRKPAFMHQIETVISHKDQGFVYLDQDLVRHIEASEEVICFLICLMLATQPGA